MTQPTSERPIALIADDDELMRLMLSEAATSAGFTARAVENGDLALEDARHCSPDIIILDVNMPIMDGFTACEKFRLLANHRLTPIVMVTGDDDSGSIDRAYQSGATDFISKPVNWSLLAHRLRYIYRSAQTLLDLAARERRIHKLAYFDHLTGLPNGLMLRETVAGYLETVETAAKQVALVHLDLLGFKRINDSFGYGVGDIILTEVANRLGAGVQQFAEEYDARLIVTRATGDEFIAAVEASSAQEVAGRLAQEWTDRLAKPFHRDNNELHLTPNIGVACSPAHGENFDLLAKSASAALAAAKIAAKNGISFFDESMKDAALRRLQLESALREALRGDLLEMHYQPKYSVDRGEISGVEALLRWHDKERGWVSPAEVVELAEETGIVLDLNRWIVDKVCQDLTSWNQRGIAVPVAINLSATEFVQGNPLSLIECAASKHSISPSMIEVEITESTLLQDVDSTCSILRQLKDAGVRVSVDDFGTGYSSLAYLKRFDIDYLKIDQSFVKELGSNPEDRSICQAMIALAKSLSIGVVAEGVETFEQHSWLAGQECDLVQGYLWSKPLSANDMTALLLESARQPQSKEYSHF